MAYCAMRQGLYWQRPELWSCVSHEDASNGWRIPRIHSWECQDSVGLCGDFSLGQGLNHERNILARVKHLKEEGLALLA